MDEIQTGELLARIQVHDNRRVDELVIEEWHHSLAEIAFDDALHVVREHRRTSIEYLTANHVLLGVRALHAQRTAGVDQIQPPPFEELDPDDWRAFQAWQRATIAAAAAGQLQVPAPSEPSLPPPEVRALLERTGRRVPPV